MTTPRFTITRHFAAPRERVWAAWTQPEQLARWFGPKGSAGTILAFDPRPGGEWRGRMETPDGATMFSKFVFREVTPPSRLVWVHGFADAAGNRIRAPFAAQFPLELLTTVDFAEDGAGTRITLAWEPLDASPEEEAFFASMMASMEGGWSGSFEQLDALLV
ncbi:MAG: SRPBCC domain-containing protein [Sphingomonas sp.]|uniref:SRPBCC family protein n=1 Tax=Sphingomonas sp. TaxID=28214 RepID=UPI0025E7F9A6|nr:SRPBCC domain-containing protein [Sphingomonas sp.]MBX9880584.1 SRPBCC domain-containing protein [Sphingomonas sp.]